MAPYRLSNSYGLGYGSLTSTAQSSPIEVVSLRGHRSLLRPARTLSVTMPTRGELRKAEAGSA